MEAITFRPGRPKGCSVTALPVSRTAHNVGAPSFACNGRRRQSITPSHIGRHDRPALTGRLADPCRGVPRPQTRAPPRSPAAPRPWRRTSRQHHDQAHHGRQRHRHRHGHCHHHARVRVMPTVRRLLGGRLGREARLRVSALGQLNGLPVPGRRPSAHSSQRHQRRHQHQHQVWHQHHRRQHPFQLLLRHWLPLRGQAAAPAPQTRRRRHRRPHRGPSARPRAPPHPSQTPQPRVNARQEHPRRRHRDLHRGR
mmetsp:Transcript_14551/g.39857  ORF Transcript_14551/g.39857 Transcript_14551/m.39857 type:complete len:253 (+) Transcript_14551:17-775(+)